MAVCQRVQSTDDKSSGNPKAQNESQWIVSQRILSALTIPGSRHLLLPQRPTSCAPFWRKEYKAVATPSELERSSTEQGDAPMRAYELEHSWRSMRQRHAKECWMFVKQHQSQLLQHFEHTTTQQYFKQEAIAKIAEYTEQLKGYYSSDSVKRLTDKALVWTELKTRSSMGFWSEKTASMKAKQQKRQQELDKAQASYESMDARALFAALTLEAQGVKKQQDGSDKHKRGKPPITVFKTIQVEVDQS